MENSTLISSIPLEKQEKRGWSVTLNGVLLKKPSEYTTAESVMGGLLPLITDIVKNGVSKIEIHNPNFGTLAYGLTAPGYDGWAFHEIGGGGSVIIPYAHVDSVWQVGLLEQGRHNQGGKVLNLPRGFLKPGESHFKTASREFTEETDYVGKPELLPGEPMNPNSAFFETAERGEGVKFYALQIPPQHLEKVGNVWTFKKSALIPSNEDTKAQKLAEQILTVRFIPLTEAMKVGDMFTVAGVGRLTATKLM